MADVNDAPYLPSPEDAAASSAADIFSKSDLQKKLDENKRQALEKLTELKKRSAPPDKTTFALGPSKYPGVQVMQPQTVKDPDAAAILPWEAQRRQERIQSDLSSANNQAAQEQEVNRAQQQTQILLDQLDGKDLGRDPKLPSSNKLLEQALQQGGDAASSLTTDLVLKANQPNGLGTAGARALATNLATLFRAQTRQGGSEWAMGGSVHGLGGMPPVDVMTPDAASAAGLPVDSVLRDRAASGQPVFVGQGSNVARLSGPGSPPSGGGGSFSVMGSTPPASTVAPEAAAAPPKDHAHHIADMVKAGISGIHKLIGGGAAGGSGQTLSQPEAIFSQPAAMAPAPVAAPTPRPTATPAAGGGNQAIVAQMKARADQLRASGLDPASIAQRLKQEFPGLG